MPLIDDFDLDGIQKLADELDAFEDTEFRTS
jgi:hypothetical protein